MRNPFSRWPREWVRANFFIYVLADPRDHQVKYVGCTVDPAQRLRYYVSGPGDGSAGKWIDELREAGVRPEMRIVDMVPKATQTRYKDDPQRAVALRIEQEWIRRLRRNGLPIVNVLNTYRLRVA